MGKFRCVAAAGLLSMLLWAGAAAQPKQNKYSICSVASTNPNDDDLHYGTFPEGFMWSTATSAYQIEGGWDADGKGPSIWDTFSHTPEKIVDGSNGDIACDSYNNYKEDVKLLKDIGVGYYRFSISWPRVLPQGQGTVNQAGVDYYKNLLNELKSAGIEPQVTLYHWDLPQALEDKGGWLEESVVVKAFEEYADLCFREFGPQVKFWITFNEPWITSWLGYGVGVFAPGKFDMGSNPYIATHNILKAHARVYHLYDSKYRNAQGGQIGITLNGAYSEPKDPNNADDVTAAERNLQFDFGWFANPIFVNGDYPDTMKLRIAEKSKAKGLDKSRLPEFTEEEKKSLKGTSDFFGLNMYTAVMVGAQVMPIDTPSYELDRDSYSYANGDWPGSGSDWLKVTPWAMRKLLRWIKERYGNPPILVTENGVSDRTGTLQDVDRIAFYKHYINNVLKAIDIDGCNVIGYTAWSLMDNFEWAQGYTEKFGLHYVDFNDPKRPRKAKDSAKYYKQLIKDNGFFNKNKTENGIENGLPSSGNYSSVSFSVLCFAVFFKMAF